MLHVCVCVCELLAECLLLVCPEERNGWLLMKPSNEIA